MPTKNLYVKNFCSKDYYSDRELEEKFLKDDGYKVLLRLIDTINDYAYQVNAIANVINILESWKEEEFYSNDTTYDIDWFRCYSYDMSITKVTLSQAKKLYKETKIKYDTLYNLIKETSAVHYKDNKEYMIENYFSFQNIYTD